MRRLTRTAGRLSSRSLFAVASLQRSGWTRSTVPHDAYRGWGIGDTVNLAARLETHTEVVQRAILIDQAARAALSERIAVEALGPVPFRGKAAAVEVFSVNPGQKR